MEGARTTYGYPGQENACERSERPCAAPSTAPAAHLTSLPVLDGSPCSLFPLPSSVSRQESQHTAAWPEGTGLAGCSDVAQEQLVGHAACRSCSWLLVLQQLGLSGSHSAPVAFFLPQTAVWWGPLHGGGLAATPAVTWKHGGEARGALCLRTAGRAAPQGSRAWWC